jgi:hypothetical protein
MRCVKVLLIVSACALGMGLIAPASQAEVILSRPSDSVSFCSLLADMVNRDLLARSPHPYYTCHQSSSYERTSTSPHQLGWYANRDWSHFIRAEQNQGRTEWVILDTEGYPYVFVPIARYDYIQNVLRLKGERTLTDARLKVVNNFRRQFNKILRRAGVEKGTFHDFRRTAITMWFANGMSEHDVMILAGHSSFATTHEFYLAVADDLIGRARTATEQGLRQKLVQIGADAF